MQAPAQLFTEYVEVESGKKNQRPQLLAAIAEARRVGATLLIAKLDRLSRNAGFIFALRDSGVEFVCCDTPDANTLTVGLFAVIAQHERETISKRTKEALTAKKARGPNSVTRRISRPLSQIAEELTQTGYRTRRGNLFQATTIWRLLPSPDPIPL